MQAPFRDLFGSTPFDVDAANDAQQPQTRHRVGAEKREYEPMRQDQRRQRDQHVNDDVHIKQRVEQNRAGEKSNGARQRDLSGLLKSVASSAHRKRDWRRRRRPRDQPHAHFGEKVFEIFRQHQPGRRAVRPPWLDAQTIGDDRERYQRDIGKLMRQFGERPRHVIGGGDDDERMKTMIEGPASRLTALPSVLSAE